MSGREPEYHGAYYSFGGLIVDPSAQQAHVPVFVGGRSLRSLRRAVELADGWCPFAVTPEQATEWLHRVDVPEAFEIRLPPSQPFDPMERSEQALDSLQRLREAGATTTLAYLVHHSLEHYLEQLEALAALNPRRST